MEYFPFKPPLSEDNSIRSRRLYRFAHDGRLLAMKDILKDDTVIGIADYHNGPGTPRATTLTVYLAACRLHEEKALNGIKLLVKHGANVSTEIQSGNFGDSAMSYAVCFDLIEVARYLFANNAKIGFYHFWSVEMTRLFIKNGYDITSPDLYGQTLLHCSNGTTTNLSKLRHFLVDQGCDMDTRDNVGDTPLHHAARYGCVACITDLCHMGARIDIRNNRGQTPLQVVIYEYNSLACRESRNTLIEVRERKRILEEEPMRRQAIEYMGFYFSKCELPDESGQFKPEDSRSNIPHLGPDMHRLIMKQLHMVPYKEK